MSGHHRLGPKGLLHRRHLLSIALAVQLASMGCSPTDRPSAPGGSRYDVVLQGGTVVDGSGTARFRADVGIRWDRIARVDRNGIPAEEAVHLLDATGLMVTPGFVDHHAHIQTRIHEHPLAENFVRQGITTILASLHSGDQPFPLDQYARSLKIAPNVGFFAGHSWVRRQALGMDDREPTVAELERMKQLVAESMQQGALGLSTGLLYVPAHYAKTEEVIELAKVAALHGGLYYTHMRDEGRGLLDSVAEAITIGRAAGIPVQIQHHKAMGAAQWGWTEKTLTMIDDAVQDGLDVKHDLYPYTAGSTGSSVLFPQWSLAGGPERFRERIEDRDTRARIEAEMTEMFETEWVGDDLARIQFRRLRSDPRYDGKTLADLAADRGMPNTVASGIQLAIELQLAGGFSAIYHFMDERDVERVMRHPLAMFQTDGDPVVYGKGFPHPRSYGAFPRVLARYVRELGWLSLEDAIRRMTHASMVQIGQTERGLIKEGMVADVTVFDFDRIQDLATYTDPHRYAVGIEHVIVNGVPILNGGRLTGARPGRVLVGPARPKDAGGPTRDSSTGERGAVYRREGSRR